MKWIYKVESAAGENKSLNRINEKSSRNSVRKRNHTDSIVSKERLLTPVEKNSALALAQGSRLPAVKAGNLASDSVASEGSLRIVSNALHQGCPKPLGDDNKNDRKMSRVGR